MYDIRSLSSLQLTARLHVQVNGPIDDHVSNLVVAQLLFLESEDPEKAVRPAAESKLGSKTT